ncbi:hypothetical protein [Salinibacterium sp. ZJ450]|uniref:hypothetical protein n=1 Tax=Salinibacterium sp. ZJ450 TaxID=2708338 RepID=UPI001422B045|nr:hypothetical protein [Salinibacterium sp. ZJ450]
MIGSRSIAVLALVVAASLAGCAPGQPPDQTADQTSPDQTSPDQTTSTPSATSAPGPVIDPGDGGNYQPDLTAADTVAAIDNQYLPLEVGSRWVYEGESDGEIERTEVVVTDQRRTVMGIDAVVVRDSVTVNGQLVEDTFDWFTQDTDGNVWYLGEDVKEYDAAGSVSTAGSWEAGVDGALPGIVMPGVPRVGAAYRQEFYPGEAEDLMQVLRVDERMTVTFGYFEQVITTQEWNPLEPEVVEEKSYAPGIGMIVEKTVRGGSGTAELIELNAP